MSAPPTVDLQQQLEALKDGLIEQVETTFGSGPGQLRLPEERAPLRNLLELATSTTSVKEVDLFIRYQIGRHQNDWAGWGPKLLDMLPNVARGEDRELRIAAVRLFLGYLVRYARWLNKDKRSATGGS